MTPLGLVPMRLAATVTHALPGLRLRLRYGDATVLEVARSIGPDASIVTPCAFRHAVARAHRQLQNGCRLQFLGLPEGCSPTVDIGARPTDRIYPGGIYRLAAGEAHIHAFATTLSPMICRTILDTPEFEAKRVQLHADAATDITIVHTIDTVATEPPALLEDLLATCFAEEVTSGITRY